MRAVALVHGVEAQKPRLAAGLRLAALADLDGRGPRLLVGAHPLAIALRPAQVVEVAVGNRRQAGKLRLTIDRELALENVPRGRTAEPLVGLVDRGQKRNVGLRVAAGKTGPLGRLGLDPPGSHVTANQPRGLGPAQTRHPRDVSPQQPLGAACLQSILMPAEQSLYPAINLSPAAS